MCPETHSFPKTYQLPDITPDATPEGSPITPCANCGQDPTEFDDETAIGDGTWRAFWPLCPWCYFPVSPKSAREHYAFRWRQYQICRRVLRDLKEVWDLEAIICYEGFVRVEPTAELLDHVRGLTELLASHVMDEAVNVADRYRAVGFDPSSEE